MLPVDKRRNGESMSLETIGCFGPEFVRTDMNSTPPIIPLRTLAVLASARHLRRFQAVQTAKNGYSGFERARGKKQRATWFNRVTCF